MCRTQEMPVLHSFEYCMKMSLCQAAHFRQNKEQPTVSPTLVCSFRLLQHLPARGEERPITNKCCYPLVLRTSCTSTSFNCTPRNEQLLDLPNFESVARTEWRTLQLKKVRTVRKNRPYAHAPGSGHLDTFQRHLWPAHRLSSLCT